MKLRSSFIALVAVTLGAVAGCAGADTSTSTTAASGNGLEQTEITVGTIAAIGAIPLHMAKNKGYFQQEGLTVNFKVLSGGAEAIPQLKAGTLDFTESNYISAFLAKSTGAVDLRVVSDSLQSGPGTHVVMVPKDSRIEKIADLRNAKIAVNTKRNISTLLVRIAAQAHGFELDEDRNFVEVPLPEMEAALKSGTVDAAQVAEPFVTQVSQSIGARTIWDTAQGPTKDFPIAGVMSTADFVEKNPKTVAAFQRAMRKASETAADRAEVVATIPTYTKITPDVAGSLAFGVFPTTLSASRLQRVADSMLEYKFIDKPLAVKDILVVPSDK